MLKSLAWIGLATVTAALAADSLLEAKDAWVRWLPANLPAGAYVTLVNHGERPVAVVGLTSTDYGSVMLHQSTTQGGVSQMSPVRQIVVPAHTSLSFEASGYHAMLAAPIRPIHPGDNITLVLHFSDGSSLSVPFSVRPPDGGAAR